MEMSWFAKSVGVTEEQMRQRYAEALEHQSKMTFPAEIGWTEELIEKSRLHHADFPGKLLPCAICKSNVCKCGGAA